MSELLIHIGLHKTATTYLQRYYFPSLTTTTYFGLTAPHFYLGLGKTEFENTLLISNEKISGMPWNRGWLHGKANGFHWMDSFATGIQNLERLHPTAAPIIVFRRHGDLLVSMYKQYIQEGGILNFEGFYGDTGVIRDRDLCFQERMRILESYFSRVFYLSYEDFAREGDSYMDDFFSEFGLFTSHGEDRKRVNVSVAGFKVDILRTANKIFRWVPEEARILTQKLRISPRDIVQQRLAFWHSKDSEAFDTLRREVNDKFSSDWNVVRSKLWRPCKTRISTP